MKIHFYYSAMNAGKSSCLLQSNFNYGEMKMNTIVLSPAIDDREGVGKVKSRIGLECDATPVHDSDNLFELVKNNEKIKSNFGAVFVDEAQFLTKAQVDQLSDIVDLLNIPVLAYGLRTDSFGELFEGSQRLLAIADELIELKTICKCARKATMVVRYDDNGQVVTEGGQVEIGGNNTYVSMCRKHWKEAMKKNI